MFVIAFAKILDKHCLKGHNFLYEGYIVFFSKMRFI